MRLALVFALLAVVAAPAPAQLIPLDHLDDAPAGYLGRGTRLEIDIVTLTVIPESVVLGDPDDFWEYLDSQVWSQNTDVFTAVHDAMDTLGVHPWNYNLKWSSHGGTDIVCSEADLLSEQRCEAYRGRTSIGNVMDYLNELNDGEMPLAGHIQLYVVLLGDSVAWRGKLGTARWQWWGDREDHHWSTTSCRAWSLHSVPILAHELGHCFHLRHNEDDLDFSFGLDLMVSYYTHYSWVKEYNRKKVDHHFRVMLPEQSVFRTQPQFEQQF